MHKIRSFLNRNRKMIILVLGGIVFLILILQMLNFVAKQTIKNNNKNKDNTTTNNNLPTTSKITGEKTNTKVAQSNKNIIEKFVDYCNKANISSAYEMLTDECKNTLYKTENDFKECRSRSFCFGCCQKRNNPRPLTKTAILCV